MTKTSHLHQLSSSIFIPELVEIIADHLTPPVLLKCIQVCRAWESLYTPCLYKYLDDTLYSWPTIIDPPSNSEPTYSVQQQKDPEWLRGIFEKHGHHIRHLKTSRYLFSDAASVSNKCTQLLSLTMYRAHIYYFPLKMPIVWQPDQLSTDLERSSWATDRTWIGLQWIWLLIQQNCQTLKKLELCSSIIMAKGEGLLNLLASCPRLRKLVLDNFYLPFQTLLERLPTLREFCFLSECTSYSDLLLISPIPHLISLRIQMGLPRHVLLTLLVNLPNLKKFWTGTRYEDFVKNNSQLSANITYAPSQLQRLYFTRHRQSDDDKAQIMLNEILIWVPDLIEIGLPYLDAKCAVALIKYCPKLQVFRQSIISKTIHQSAIAAGTDNSLSWLLINYSHLRVFDGIRHRIKAEHIIANPWSCLNLVILRLQIINVIRLSEEEEIDYRQGILFQRINKPLSEAEAQAVRKYDLKVRVQHQRIYSQLAKLTQLQELELGMEFRDIDRVPMTFQMIQRGAQIYRNYGHPSPDTLELSLASGLDQLSTLTRLEVFGFEGVNHRIDEEELIWMAEKWPWLRVMRGLHEVNLPLLMHDGDRWHRRVFMQQLRPDVRHERRIQESVFE